MFQFFFVVCSSFVFSGVWSYAPLREPVYGPQMFANEADLLQDALDLDRINREMEIENEGSFYDHFGSKRLNEFGAILPGRAKDSEFLDEDDYDLLLGPSGNPSIRDSEYLQHSTVFGGHKYLGGGEGLQKIKGGQAEKELKPDSVLPAYCNPPNPCPVGFSSEDGCIEIFENTASFSRAFQASQDCMCDTEHMFDCPAPRESDDGDSSEMNGPNFIKKLQVGYEGEHKSLVAKKFYNTKSQDAEEDRVNELARSAALLYADDEAPAKNPFLEGDKLPIAAKKGNIH